MIRTDVRRGFLLAVIRPEVSRVFFPNHRGPRSRGRGEAEARRSELVAALEITHAVDRSFTSGPVWMGDARDRNRR